ncbi:MAG: COG1470 family protein [Armatimonadota bacterium]
MWRSSILLSLLLALCLRVSAGVSIKVGSDRITYPPGAKGTVTVTLNNTGEAVNGTLSVRLIEGIDRATPLFSGPLTLGAGETVTKTFPMEIGTAQWGRGLEARLNGPGVAALGTHAFSVIVNPYQTALHGAGLPQAGVDGWDEQTARQKAEEIVARNIASYCNIYEAFAWAPCDYSKMTLENDEPFWSGQAMYCRTRLTLRVLHETMKKYGIGAITYGKTCAAGEPGVFYAFRHPEQMMTYAPAGWCHEAISVDVMDRMAEGRYARFGRDDWAWQYWISSWTQIANYDAVNFGCDEIVRSGRQLGWDGVRYDGHFTGAGSPEDKARMVRYAGERIQKQFPGFALGYNCCSDEMTDPEVSMTDPELAAMAHNGGEIMSEVYRNFTAGIMHKIRHLQSVGDATRMNGGYFLTITDMNSIWEAALMHCGGARPMQGARDFFKFVTRFSAYIYDPAMRRLHAPQRIMAPVGDPGFLWDAFVYERKTSPTESQLILQLLNVSREFEFHKPWGFPEKPPTGVNPPREQVAFHLRLPPGYQVARAFASDDNINFLPQDITFTDTTLIVPRVNIWTMVVIDLQAQNPPRTLAEICTIPLKKGTPVTPEVLEKIIAGGPPVNTAPSMATLTADADFNKHQDGIDRKGFIGTDTPPTPLRDGKPDADAGPQHVERTEYTDAEKPLTLWRDGRSDIHYACGILYRWNRPWEALMRVPGARVTTSSLNNGRSACNELLSEKNRACVAKFPTRADLSTTDVLVIDNIPAAGFTKIQRHDVLDYVRGGGSLLVLGDWHGLSKGCWEGSFLEEALPVMTRQSVYLRRLQGKDQIISPTPAYQQVLKKAPPSFGDDPVIDWTSHLKLKEGAQVLLQAGTHPFLITGTCGAGRVAVFAGSHSGTPAHPYWESTAWPQTVADVLAWLSEPAQAMVKPGAELAALRERLNTNRGLSQEEAALSLHILLAAGNEEQALYVAKYLLEHPDAVSLTEARRLVIDIVPFIRATAAWQELGDASLPLVEDKEMPETLSDNVLPKAGVRVTDLLGAAIAAVASEGVTAETFLNWEGLDTATRLWCLGLRGDTDALPALKALDARLAKQERTLGDKQNPYAPRLIRPFLSFALARCGGRSEKTLYDFCSSALRLPFINWREYWVLESLYSAAFHDHTETMRLRIRSTEQAIREMSYGEQLLSLIFRPEMVGLDDIGKRAAAKALQEADSLKCVPLMLGFLDRLPKEDLPAFRGLAQSKLDVMREYMKGK